MELVKTAFLYWVEPENDAIQHIQVFCLMLQYFSKKVLITHAMENNGFTILIFFDFFWFFFHDFGLSIILFSLSKCFWFFLHKVSEPNNLLTIFKYWIFLFFLYEVYLIQIHGTFQANQCFVRSVNDILFVVLFVPSFLLLIKTDVFFIMLLLVLCCLYFVA